MHNIVGQAVAGNDLYGRENLLIVLDELPLLVSRML